MVKEKSKGKAKTRNISKKKKTAKRKRDAASPVAGNGLSNVVESEAMAMAQAVIIGGKRGELATVKYLFEVAEIFPGVTDGAEATAEEESLARTLLKRLNIPDEPMKLDDEEEAVGAASSVSRSTDEPAQ
jgi:hypothetical protein